MAARLVASTCSNRGANDGSHHGPGRIEGSQDFINSKNKKGLAER